MHMRTTIILDKELLERAAGYTGIKGTTALVHAGLRSLVQDEVARRLIALGGLEPSASVAARRRFPPAERRKARA